MTGLSVRDRVESKAKLAIIGSLRVVVGLLLPIAGFGLVVYGVLKLLGPSVKAFPLWLYLHQVFALFCAWAVVTLIAIVLGLKVMSWGMKRGAHFANKVEGRLNAGNYFRKETR